MLWKIQVKEWSNYNIKHARNSHLIVKGFKERWEITIICNTVPELAHTSSQELIVHISFQVSFQKCHIGSLKSATVRVFIPQKLANTTNQRIFLWIATHFLAPIALRRTKDPGRRNIRMVGNSWNTTRFLWMSNRSIVGTEIIRGEGRCMYQNMDWLILEACLKVKEPGF